MLQTLRSGGNVLLPTDTAGRVLELLLCIDQYWTYNRYTLSFFILYIYIYFPLLILVRLSNYSVALLNNVSYNTVEFAKSQLEWMSDTVMKTFDNSRENPFAFKYVNLCHNLEELDVCITILPSSASSTSSCPLLKITRRTEFTKTNCGPS